MKSWLWLVVSGGVIASGLAAAATNTFRCGSDLVYEGDGRSRVLAKCGPPTDIVHSVALRTPAYWRSGRPIYFGDGPVEVPVEVWTYNLGPNSFMRRLRFEDGQLIQIETLGYGYNR